MSRKKSTPKGSSPSTATKKKRAHVITPQRPRAVPSVSYENVIQARAAEITARGDLGRLAPEFRTEEHRERIHAQNVESQRARFREYEVLGNHFADVLESENTPAEVHNAVLLELDDLSNRSRVMITSPDVLRLIYPLMCDRLFEKEGH